MNISRARFGATVLDEHLYVTGGETGGDRVSQSLEVFDFATELWKELAPMAVRRVGHGMASTNGKLLVAGGYDQYSEPRKSVEVYDIENNTWSSVSDLLSAYESVHLGVLSDPNRVLLVGKVLPNGEDENSDDEETWGESTERECLMYENGFAVYNMLSDTWEPMPVFEEEEMGDDVDELTQLNPDSGDRPYWANMEKGLFTTVL